MRKDKKYYVAAGAGFGMIFGYVIWNAGIGLVPGAAIGLLLFAIKKDDDKSPNQ